MPAVGGDKIFLWRRSRFPMELFKSLRALVMDWWPPTATGVYWRREVSILVESSSILHSPFSCLSLTITASAELFSTSTTLTLSPKLPQNVSFFCYTNTNATHHPSLSTSSQPLPPHISYLSLCPTSLTTAASPKKLLSKCTSEYVSTPPRSPIQFSPSSEATVSQTPRLTASSAGYPGCLHAIPSKGCCPSLSF